MGRSMFTLMSSAVKRVPATAVVCPAAGAADFARSRRRACRSSSIAPAAAIALGRPFEQADLLKRVGRRRRRRTGLSGHSSWVVLCPLAGPRSRALRVSPVRIATHNLSLDVEGTTVLPLRLRTYGAALLTALIGTCVL